MRLIPRLREWIDQYYPGTKLGITEWNYGADGTLNGALAIAEVLGIFGREGVDLAAYWRAPKPGAPGALAFALYRDYDGRGGQFGDESLAVERRDQHLHAVSVFASRDSQSGNVIVLVINKEAARSASVDLEIMAGRGWSDHAPVYRYGGADLQSIVTAGDVPSAAGKLTIGLPPSSIALVRVPAAAP